MVVTSFRQIARSGPASAGTYCATAADKNVEAKKNKLNMNFLIVLIISYKVKVVKFI